MVFRPGNEGQWRWKQIERGGGLNSSEILTRNQKKKQEKEKKVAKLQCFSSHKPHEKP